MANWKLPFFWPAPRVDDARVKVFPRCLESGALFAAQSIQSYFQNLPEEEKALADTHYTEYRGLGDPWMYELVKPKPGDIWIDTSPDEQALWIFAEDEDLGRTHERLLSRAEIATFPSLAQRCFWQLWNVWPDPKKQEELIYHPFISDRVVWFADGQSKVVWISKNSYITLVSKQGVKDAPASVVLQQKLFGGFADSSSEASSTPGQGASIKRPSSISASEIQGPHKKRRIGATPDRPKSASLDCPPSSQGFDGDRWQIPPSLASKFEGDRLNRELRRMQMLAPRHTQLAADLLRAQIEKSLAKRAAEKDGMPAKAKKLTESAEQQIRQLTAEVEAANTAREVAEHRAEEEKIAREKAEKIAADEKHRREVIESQGPPQIATQGRTASPSSMNVSFPIRPLAAASEPPRHAKRIATWREMMNDAMERMETENKSFADEARLAKNSLQVSQQRLTDLETKLLEQEQDFQGRLTAMQDDIMNSQNAKDEKIQELRLEKEALAVQLEDTKQEVETWKKKASTHAEGFKRMRAFMDQLSLGKIESD